MWKRTEICFLALFAFLFSCNTATVNKDGIIISCDSTRYKTYSKSPCGFGFCYLNTWDELGPVYGGWDVKISEPLKDSSDTYSENFSVLSNFTQNGYTLAMGSFKNYVDSSRKQIKIIIQDITFQQDADTSWNRFNAHIFEYSGKLFGDSLHISQWVINANTYDQLFVLSFVQKANTAEHYDEIKRDLFESFRLPVKRCGQ